MWAVGVTGRPSGKQGWKVGKSSVRKTSNVKEGVWTFPEGKGAFKEILAVKRQVKI